MAKKTVNMSNSDQSEVLISDKLQLKDLQIALLQHQNTRMQAEHMLKQAEQAVTKSAAMAQKAMEAAGLDPSKQYNIDFETGRAKVSN